LLSEIDFIFLNMRNLEVKVVRFLIFISLLFFNYHLMIHLTSFFAPEGFLDEIKKIGGFFVNFFGLHGLFALCTFVSSRILKQDRITLLFLSLAILAPIMYSFFLPEANISEMFIVIISIFLFEFFRRDFKCNIVKTYFRIISDPFYFHDEDQQF
jgi:hypothetical protein